MTLFDIELEFLLIIAAYSWLIFNLHHKYNMEVFAMMLNIILIEKHIF